MRLLHFFINEIRYVSPAFSLLLTEIKRHLFKYWSIISCLLRGFNLEPHETSNSSQVPKVQANHNLVTIHMPPSRHPNLVTPQPMSTLTQHRVNSYSITSHQTFHDAFSLGAAGTPFFPFWPAATCWSIILRPTSIVSCIPRWRCQNISSGVP